MDLDIQIQCVKTELKRRRKIYPRLIEKGVMKEKYGNLQIGIMQKVYESLHELRDLLES